MPESFIPVRPTTPATGCCACRRTGRADSLGYSGTASNNQIHSGLQESGAESLSQRFVRGVSWNLVGTVLAQGSVFMANVGIAYLRYKVLERGRLLQGENQTRPRILGLQVSGFLSRKRPVSHCGSLRSRRPASGAGVDGRGLKHCQQCHQKDGRMGWTASPHYS